MKRIAAFLIFGILVTSLDSCTKSLFTGQVTFWYDSPGTTATVQIGNKTGTITEWYSSQPNCGSSGCANFTLPAGDYNYTAASTFNTWTGSVTVEANRCWTIRLY